MLSERVLFTGTSCVSHPVLDQLFGGYLAPAEDPSNLGDSILVVVDARLGATFGEGSITQRALEAGVAVLILSPGQGQLDPLASIVGVVPQPAAQAVFIAPNRNRSEKMRHAVAVLEYPPRRNKVEQRSEDLPGIEGESSSDEGCACGDCAGAFEDTVLANFGTLVEEQVIDGYHPAPLAIPDGLKFLQTSFANHTYFDNDYCDKKKKKCFKNGEGSTIWSYEVWLFLNQTPTSNSQYLIIQGTYNFFPGKLAGNNDKTRGWANTLGQSEIEPPSTFVAIDHIPTNRKNKWDESFSIRISYKDPLGGGYQVYTFEAVVAQSIDKWSVQNISSGRKAGSKWFVNSPLDGSNIGKNWKDAFTFWGHVKDLPAACTGTLTVKEASAWRTDTIYRGGVLVMNTLYWNDTVFYGTGCSPGICNTQNMMYYEREAWPWFTVDFSSVVP